ncbi:NADH:ubiquinone reductase (H(+)-translocating) [Handroanthus impetiginosus]|uniref:NADH:ubiquinone reductase (H(+)-translocating) n=1 Tax=Handroanthus impetiginosus TaxID=429701 RepID=A0A2G9GH10_9LAMI|nr:NADH:ubiquinone reductase (H(+)-translocating) [Handroanthus impetiginosus]
MSEDRHSPRFMCYLSICDFGSAPKISMNAKTLICISQLIGAVGKSAQIGLHIWSPDAREGPTPVFALIHAITMVIARFFMIASVFQLMNHTFLKALPLMSVSLVIHAMSNEQDMRKIGLASSLPFTYDMMLMHSLSLIGFPFLTRFYYKDVILLELTYTNYTISGNFAFWLGSVSILFTSYYSFGSLFLTFLVPTNSFKQDIL